MGRIYTAEFSNVAVIVAQTLLEITAASDSIVVIHSAFIGQDTDYGDAAAEGLRVRITRYATGGTGGTLNIGESNHQLGDSLFGGTIDRNHTVPGGTPVVILTEVMNIQAGWFYTPTPEERIVISPSGILGFDFPDAPADSITVAVRVTFEEIGG